ncbi:hypothetical protein Tco_0672339 [Tanacetum coccineum]
MPRILRLSIITSTGRLIDGSSYGEIDMVIKGLDLEPKINAMTRDFLEQQRLYKSNHTAKEMTWHAIGKFTENGKMQHLVDGKAWKNFDTRDVRLS